MTIETLNRKDQINQVAQNLFREKGYAATSMRDLAKAIGIEAASLYSHIKSKEELLQNICFRIATEFFDEYDRVQNGTTDSKQLFRNAVKAHTRVVASNIDASTVFFNEWRHLNEPSLSEFKKQRAAYENRFKALLKEGIEAGVFREVQVSFAMRLVFSTLNGIPTWYRPDGPLSPDQIADQIADFLLEGLLNK